VADNVKSGLEGGLKTALYILLFATCADAQTWQVGTAPSFLTGSYGGDTHTEIFYAPVTAKRVFKNGDFTAVVPYLCVTGATGVTIVGDSAIRTGSTGTIGTRDAAATRPARGSTTTPPAAPTATVQRQCGLGDVVLRGRYYLLDERAWFPTIAVRAHIKTPTADADRGLGTGRPDEGIGLEVTRSIGAGLSAMADGGYTVIGQPEGMEFNRPWWYDVGLGQDLARGAVNVSVFFEEYQAIVPGLPNARDVLAALTLKGRGWQAQLAAQFGASDGAAERGLTVGISRRF
jgi:hypothetical protein